MGLQCDIIKADRRYFMGLNALGAGTLPYLICRI